MPTILNKLTRIQQHGVFAVHKPSGTKTSSVEKDLIVEKYSPNSSAAFWRSCFQALVFQVMLRHSRSGQDMKRTNSSMSKVNRVTASQPACTRSAASLQLEIPTWDIKLGTVLPWKKQGGMETAVQLSRSREGFRKSAVLFCLNLSQGFTAVHWKHWIWVSHQGHGSNTAPGSSGYSPSLSRHPLTHCPVRTDYGDLICLSTCKQKEATEAWAEFLL